MDISEIGHLDRPRPRELLEDAPPAVVRVWGDGTGTLMMGGLGGKPGARLRLRGVKTRALSLDDALAGLPAAGDRRPVPPTGPGDVVVLEAARVYQGELLCGGVAARMHDDLRGEVQAFYALARPTRLTVSRFGATQFVKLIDPTLARVADGPAAVAEAAHALVAASWTGGRAGFLVRNAHKRPGRMSPGELGACREFDLQDGEDAARFARRLVEVERILEAGEGEYALAGGAVELIPSAVLPVGREQMFREGGNLAEPASPRVGNHGRHYVTRGRLGFVPSFVIVGDEPEFKFKAPTGAYERRCVALEPRSGVTPVGHSGVATPVRPLGTTAKPVPVIAPAVLFKGSEVAEAAAGRAARRGPDPAPGPAREAVRSRPGAPAPRIGRPGPAPRTGSGPGTRPARPAAPLARLPAVPPPQGGLAELAGLAALDLDLDDGHGFGP